jgi:class 3 adenylate cyclase
LIGVTHIVQEHGRVVKYIGDEVMAVFEDSSCVLHAEHAAENILDFCDQLSEDNVQVKIALDFGEVSLFDFGYSPTLTPGADPESRNTLDPQGVVVDRCARLMSKASAGAVLCSAALRESSRAPERWKPVGAFRPRGIPTPVEVFLLDTRGAPDLVIRDEGMTLNECTQELARTREMLELARRLNRR